MQTEVKILTRILAKRIIIATQALINWNQIGFMRNRQIVDNIIRFLDIQELSTEMNTDAYAHLLDFEKAYDRVNWTYLQECLQAANFGKKFCKWVQILYDRPQVFLIINGFLSKPLQPSRGVKQGDPLSCILYNITIEPHLRLQQNNPRLGLAHIPSNPTADAFTDDDVLYAKDMQSVHEQLSLTKIYEAGSGAKLNLKKCILIQLNQNTKQCPSSNLRQLNPNEVTKILGFPIGINIQDETRIEIIDNILTKQLTAWKYRAKTIQGRRHIIRAKILSKLWYMAFFIDIPKQKIQKWQNYVNNFIIHNKISSQATPYTKLPNKWKYAPKSQGGLQIPNIELNLHSLRIRWLNKKTTQPSHQCDRVFQNLQQLINIKKPQWCSTMDILFWIIYHKYPFTKKTIPYASRLFISAIQYFQLEPKHELPDSIKQHIPLWQSRHPNFKNVRKPSLTIIQCISLRTPKDIGNRTRAQWK